MNSISYKDLETKGINVLGLGFGDEGKGLSTGFLTNYKIQQGEKVLNIRYNGGQQAGHTVQINGKRHVHSQLGAGMAYGADFYIDETCTFNPIEFMKEFKEFNKKFNKDNSKEWKIYVHKNVMLTTYADIVMNRQCDQTLEDGSCGAGFGKTIERNLNGCVATVGDLLYPTALKHKLKSVEDYYNRGNDVENFITDIYTIQEYQDCLNIITVVNGIEDTPYAYRTDSYIYEGAQGMLLDERWGFYPHTTWSKVNYECDNVWYVIRAYHTRHGNGPLENSKPFLETGMVDETNGYNKYQGSLRYAPLNIDYINYALSKDYDRKSKSLLITHLDQHPINVKELLSELYVDFGDRVYGSFGPEITDIRKLVV